MGIGTGYSGPGTGTYLGQSSGHEDEEAHLLERAKRQDPAALGLLYDRYAPRIYTYMSRRVGGGGTLAERMTADDLTAEVFVRMLQAIQRGNPWRTSFSGWLFRIAHNLVADHYRTASRTSQVSLDEAWALADSEADPEQATERILTREKLLRAMQYLTDEQAQVIALRFLEGLSISDTAIALNRSEGSVKGLQFRGAAALRRVLSSSPSRGEASSAPVRAVEDRQGTWGLGATLPVGVQ